MTVKIDGDGTVAVNAFRSGDAAMGSGWQKLAVDSLSLDSHGFFSVANNRYTPLIAGWYWFHANAYIQQSVVNTIATAIAKNGLLALHGNTIPSTTSGICTAGGMVYLNGSTDYVEQQVYTAGTSMTVVGNFTYLHGFLVRAA